MAKRIGVAGRRKTNGESYGVIKIHCRESLSILGLKYIKKIKINKIKEAREW